MTTTMCATVLCVQDRSLLVCDCCTRQRVVVHTDQACCFASGEHIRIEYSGAMTMSDPAQISATCISRMCC